MNIIGIVNAVEFRKSVLDQRDRLAQGSKSTPDQTSPEPTNEQNEVLTEIRDLLVKIESKLSD